MFGERWFESLTLSLAFTLQSVRAIYFPKIITLIIDLSKCLQTDYIENYRYCNMSYKCMHE